MKSHSFSMKRSLINLLYCSIIFLFAFSIATLALVRRINSYEANRQPLLLNITKEEVVVTNAAPGLIDKIYVNNGEHVQKGDLLVKLTDKVQEAKLQSLDAVAGANLSAKTEADVIRASAFEYEIRAPRDGVVFKVTISEGAYANQNSPLISLYADSNVKLTGLVDSAQYAQIQNEKTLDVYSSRFAQIYGVILEGSGRVIPSTETQGSKYELQFHFTDPNEGTAFIQGEGVEVVAKTADDNSLSPASLIKKFWNSFIFGK